MCTYTCVRVWEAVKVTTVPLGGKEKKNLSCPGVRGRGQSSPLCCSVIKRGKGWWLLRRDKKMAHTKEIQNFHYIMKNVKIQK